MPNVRLRLLDNAGSEKSKKFEYPPPSFYKFGPFTLDSRQKLLLREGVEVPLRPKVFDVLVALVQNRGQIMEKDRLMQTVWPESFVEEAIIGIAYRAPETHGHA